MKQVDKIRYTIETPADIIWPVLTAKRLEQVKKQNADAKPGLLAFFDPSDKSINELMAHAAKMMKEAFGLDKITRSMLFDPKADYRFPFIDGTALAAKAAAKGKDYSRLDGKWALRTTIYGNNWPGVGDGTKGFATADPDIVYSGSRGVLVIDLFPYDKKSKGVSAGLLSVGYLPGGERWGTGFVDPATAFSGVVGHSTTEDPRAGDDEIPF